MPPGLFSEVDQRMDQDLAARLREDDMKDIKYVLFSFTDLFGVMRSKLVPRICKSMVLDLLDLPPTSI